MQFIDKAHSYYDKEALDGILVNAAKKGASDIFLKSEHSIFFSYHEKTIIDDISKSVVDTELNAYLNEIYISSATALLSQAKDLDFSYSIKTSRSKSFRFRVNATSILLNGGNKGIELVFRVLSETPPSLEDLKVEDKFSTLLTSSEYKEGIVFVLGPTGSGKSTLLSSVISHKLKTEDKRILSYEAPIEYLYDTVTDKIGTITQSEIPLHLPSFFMATKNVLRRNAKVVLIGEARDRDTIEGVIALSGNGHLVYSTAHTNDTCSFVKVLSSKFNESQESKKEAALSLLSRTNYVVHQELVPAIGGGLVGVRELLRLDKPEYKDFIFNEIAYDERFFPTVTLALKKLLQEFGITKSSHAQELFDNGRITRKTLLSITHQDDTNSCAEQRA